MNPEAWRLSRARLAAATASGMLLWLSFPPIDAGWLSLAALAPLLLALRGASMPAGALLGFVTGAVFFAPLLWWLARFGLVAWAPLVAAMAAWIAIFGCVGARLVARGIAWRVAGVAILWTAVEIARARWPLGGIAWGGLGYASHDGGPLLPLARAGGVWLVSFATIAVNALLVEAAVAAPALRRVAAAAGAVVVLTGSSLLPIGIAGREGTIDVAAVQGNVPRGRFTSLGRARTGPEDPVVVANHVRATESLIGDAPDLIVWAENSIDRDPRRNPDLFEPVRDVVARVGAPLIAGAILDERDHFLNANLLVEPGKGITSRYVKRHLVPFGEYVPWAWARDLVPILNDEIPVNGRPGSGLGLFDVGGVRVGTVICFESTYPTIAGELARRGARILVVTTNNASYGTSPASRQHVAMSRLRAVENGRAVVHTAVSGISAMILPDGRMLRRAGLFRTSVLRARLPLATGSTPYSRYGNAMEPVLLVGGLGMMAAAVRGRRR